MQKASGQSDTVQILHTLRVSLLLKFKGAFIVAAGMSLALAMSVTVANTTLLIPADGPFFFLLAKWPRKLIGTL
jgi:hypothetical protein